MNSTAYCIICVATLINIVCLLLITRAQEVYDRRRQVYGEESIWLITHREWLMEKYQSEEIPIFLRYRTLPTNKQMVVRVWTPVEKFFENLRPVGEYYK